MADRAVDGGLADVLVYVGRLYESGHGLPQNYSKAWELYEKATRQGSRDGEAFLAGLYADGKGVPKDYAKAFGLYEKAAARGDVNAQVNLGWMYHQGEGVARDYGKAATLFRKAADQGYAAGQAYLASSCARGEGVHGITARRGSFLPKLLPKIRLQHLMTSRGFWLHAAIAASETVNKLFYTLLRHVNFRNGKVQI